MEKLVVVYDRPVARNISAERAIELLRTGVLPHCHAVNLHFCDKAFPPDVITSGAFDITIDCAISLWVDRLERIDECRAALNTIDTDYTVYLVAESVPQNAKGEPDPDAVPGLVDKVAAAGADYLYIGPDTFVGDNRVAVTKQALERRLPVFTATEFEVRTSDTLFGLVSRYDNVGRFAAYKAEQILVNNIPARDIPVETLQRFSYIVNMSVAKRLKLYPPMSVLRFAEVIGV